MICDNMVFGFINFVIILQLFEIRKENDSENTNHFTTKDFHVLQFLSCLILLVPLV